MNGKGNEYNSKCLLFGYVVFGQYRVAESSGENLGTGEGERGEEVMRFAFLQLGWWVGCARVSLEPWDRVG